MKPPPPCKDGIGDGKIWIVVKFSSKISLNADCKSDRAIEIGAERNVRLSFKRSWICLLTRGQWPYIPASTRAMRNRHVVLYDLNYPSKYITPNDLGGHLTSDLKSATLITLVSMCILPLMASEAMAASNKPRRSYDL